jgi:hypothetical protein
MNKVYNHPATGLPTVDFGGEPRQLGRLPSTIHVSGMALLRKAVPMVPRADWKAIKRRDVIGPDFILDQKSHGSCVGHGAAGALMAARALAGATFQKLSGPYVYSWINGGSDNGAIISDGCKALVSHGAALYSEVSWDMIYRRQIPATADTTAQRFRASEVYAVESFDEICSALQLGFVVSIPVMVGGSFSDLDSNGICGWDRGPGNHCVYVAGMDQVASQWALDMTNSWGTSFGEKGHGFITQKHIESVEADSYAIRCEVGDPQDPNMPPVAA